MNKIIGGVVVILVLAYVALTVASVSAQSATNEPWDSSITYYTPSAVTGTMVVNYYAGGSTYTASGLTLSPHKAGSLYIGSVSISPSIPNGFKGSAVISSDVPVVATYVQFAKSPDTSSYGRPIYGAFDPSQAGTTFYIPTILRGTGSTSLVGIQNVESVVNNVGMVFYPVGSSVPALALNQNIQPSASYVFSANDIALPSPFNGSLVITGTGKIVASAQETDDAGRGAYAFEGASSGATKIYMASMLCKTSTEQQISYYAIQNPSPSVAATVAITYFNSPTGTVAGTMPPQVLGPGAKLSRNPCQDGVPPGTLGSAVIVGTSPVIAIAKVKANNGMATAFDGQAAGALKVAAPYVRWSNPSTSEFRSYIAVMNVGSAAATNIVANYYDQNGNLAGSETLATGGNPLNPLLKRNTNPSTAGAATQSGGTFGITPTSGGAVEISSDQPIVVVVRMQKDISPCLLTVCRFAEDYNATPIP